MKPMVALMLALASLAVTTASAGPNVHGAKFRFADGHESDFHEVVVGDPKTMDTIVFTYGGSGCTDLGIDWLPRLATDMGIHARYVSLNKRHVRAGENSGGASEPCSPAFRTHDIPRQWMTDYMAFVSRTLAESDGRWKNVVLVGGSEGGALAARVARAREDITHLVVIGDGGWSMRDILGTIVGPDAVEAAWKDIAQDPGNIDTMWMGHPYRYWFDVFDHAPLADYLALDIPVLIGFGEHDRSVPVAAGQDILRTAHAAGKRNIGLVVYPGADHSLQAEGHSYLPAFLQGVGQAIITGNLD